MTPLREVLGVLCDTPGTRDQKQGSRNGVTGRGDHTPESQASHTCSCGGQRRTQLYHIMFLYLSLSYSFVEYRSSRFPLSQLGRQPASPRDSPVPHAPSPRRPVLELQEYTLLCPTFHRGTRESNSGVCTVNTLTPCLNHCPSPETHFRKPILSMV